MSIETYKVSQEISTCARIQFMRNEEDFSTWLLKQLDKKKMTYADLAKEAGINPSTVSNIIRRARNPGIDFCKAIAAPLGLPLDTVLAVAGHGDKNPETNERLSQAAYQIQNMPEEEQEKAFDFIDYLYEKTRKRPSGYKEPDTKPRVAGT